MPNALATTCEIVNTKGLHARAAAQIVTTANQFDSEIILVHGVNTAPANSLIKLLTLNAPKGSQLEIKVEGCDAEKAIKALENLIADGFCE